MTTTIDFRTAVREALDEELAADDRVIFFGEDVALAGGVFAVTPGLYEKYGRERVFDTPISELALAGAAFGAAISGLRPVVEIMFGDFLTLVMDSIVNQSTKYWFLTRRAGERAARLPIRRGCRRTVRRDPLADARVVVHGYSGAEDRHARHTGRREGPPPISDPGRQPGALLRTQAPLRHHRRRRRRSRAHRRRSHRTGRNGHHDRFRDERRARGVEGGGRHSPRTASRPRSST